MSYWKDEEGHAGIVQPFVFNHIPVNLQGSDVLQEVEAILTSQPVAKMMDNMGQCPRKALGSHLQGYTKRIADENQIVRLQGDRNGLGNLS